MIYRSLYTPHGLVKFNSVIKGITHLQIYFQQILPIESNLKYLALNSQNQITCGFQELPQFLHKLSVKLFKLVINFKSEIYFS